MPQEPNGRIGSVNVEGGAVRFAHDQSGNVTEVFEDVVYKGSRFESLLIDDWREVIGRATGGNTGDTDARTIATDDIAATARIAAVHGEALEALVREGRAASPEAVYLKRSIEERLSHLTMKYGDILRHGTETSTSPSPVPTAAAPLGFEDTPVKRGANGGIVGYDLSRGFTAPAGFPVRFSYGTDGKVVGIDAEAKIGFDTAARELLLPDWRTAFEAHVVAITTHSPWRRLNAWLRRKTLDTQETVRVVLATKFKTTLSVIYTHRQALLGLERAGLSSSPEAIFLRQLIATEETEARGSAGGKDIFR